MPEAVAWAIFFLPLASFLLIALVIRPLMGPRARLAGAVTVLAVAGSLVLSLWAVSAAWGAHGPIGYDPHPWLEVGGLRIQVGIQMDALTAVMLVVVTVVSLMVQVYSLGYMKEDPGFARYFAYMSLFTASMLGLVMARNILLVFVFWELVGLCSYLLIGFWYHRPSAARAAMKAFVVTRIGDLGFLLAILYLFSQWAVFAEAGLNPLEIPDLYEAVGKGVLSGTALSWMALGFFAGAVGKSAQFPLHIWLPDAMEGPTPVSALIHAATMVAAGVFLIARLFPVFEGAEGTLTLVAVIGGFTSVFAALMGMVMWDIKRVIAYSTISQLGLMVMALGVGAYSSAVFHLFTHAFFKALLFLGAGSANHATGTFDMRYMGGLRRHQPWTYACFLLASLSLAGVFPLSGFWSKDEILAGALLKGEPVALAVGLLGLAGVFLTAFYIFRVLFLTWHGEFRGGVEAERRAQGLPPEEHHGHGGVHLGESPAVMVGPMVVLAVLAVGAGFLANPPVGLGPIPAHAFSEFVVPPGGHPEAPKVQVGLAVLSLALAGAGILLAYLMYARRALAPERLTLRPLYGVLQRKFYLDDLAEGLLADRLYYRGLCWFLERLDTLGVDRTVEAVGWLSRGLGRVLALLQSGQAQAYGLGISLGLVALVVAYLVWGR